MQATQPEIVELYRLVAVWGIGVIGLLVTTIALLFNSRQNKLSQQIENMVDKGQLEMKLTLFEEQRLEFHVETGKKLDEIKETTTVIANQAVELGRLDVRVKMLEDREAFMAKWKHETIDPYIPGEIRNIARRVDALENRIEK